MSFDLSALAEAVSKMAGLLELVYVDLAQPGVRQVGKALETVLGLGNTALLPLAMYNEKSRIAFQVNMESYRRKMEGVPDEAVVPVAPEIGVPVLEKLAYVQDENLRELYTELLASASRSDRVNLAHPSFVNIINNLSPDEAILLRYFSRSRKLPIINVGAIDEERAFKMDMGLLIPLESSEGMTFRENNSAYLSNLVGLGLIESTLTRTLMPERYEPIERSARAMIEHVFNTDPLLKDRRVLLTRGFADTTAFGEYFFDACIRPAEAGAATRPEDLARRAWQSATT